ncbi:uncharacterized protein ACNLHF_003748 isoform 1-T2 [Anomaloglossus baeobatrachus]
MAVLYILLFLQDKSTSRTSVHILGHLHTRDPHSSLHLACVVLAARTTIPLYWNISGTHYKGQIISKEESDGTWTIINFISLLKEDNRSYEEKVICEVWLQSSPNRVHWENSEKDELHGFFASKCQVFWIRVTITGILLFLALSLHIILTFTDKI